MSLLRRQVAAEGGCGEMGYGVSGGLFSAKARAGAAAYQAFRKANPGLARAELSHAWMQHKTGMGGALVGGYPGQRADFSAVMAQHPGKSSVARAARRKLYQGLRAQYDAAHPGYVPRRRPAPRNPVPARSRPAYRRLVAASKRNPECPPFAGLDRSDAAAINHLAARLEGVQFAEVYPEEAPPSIAEAMAAEAEREAAIEEAAAELGFGLSGGRRRMRLRR